MEAQLDDFEFLALERLSLTAAGADIHERIGKAAHQLRFLDLYKPRKGKLSWDLSSMHQLDELSIDGSYSECGHEVILMIGSAPRLTTLRLARITILGSQEHKATSIPSLLSLHLRCVKIECKLGLPVLKTLVMQESKISNGKMHPLMLPSLTSLEIAWARDEDDLCIRTPALDVLDLTFSTTTSTHLIVKSLLDNSIVMGQMSPRRFRLQIDSIKAGDLITILTHMPRLEEWTFLGTITSPKSFFDKLAGRSLGATKGRTTNKVPLCPSMTTVFFDIRTWNSTNAANVEQWYEETIRVRRKGKYPIKEAFWFLKESKSGKYGSGECVRL
ncbi:hypothetical protein FRC17_011326 [Serendipita sp. 399]|nr:hypothetical protein FRC17_011326 [Serendipita sp. 399]